MCWRVYVLRPHIWNMEYIFLYICDIHPIVMPLWYPVAIRGISSSSAARPSFSPDRVCLGISTHPTLTMIMRWKYLRFSPPSQTRLATSTQRFRATHGFSFNRVVPNRYYNIVYTYLFLFVSRRHLLPLVSFSLRAPQWGFKPGTCQYGYSAGANWCH